MAVFAICGDERLICIGTGVFDIDNTGCDHLNKRETFAQAGNPRIGLLAVRVSCKQTVTAVTGFEREIDFFRFYNFLENLTGNVRREILLYKFLEGFRGINFSGYFISDSVSTLQTVLDQSQNYDRPDDKGETAEGHAFLKLVDQLFCQDI